MMDRLFNPERLVYIKRKLRYPENKITYESLKYGLAQLVMQGIPNEDNTISAWIEEIDKVYEIIFMAMGRKF